MTPRASFLLLAPTVGWTACLAPVSDHLSVEMLSQPSFDGRVCEEIQAACP